MENVSDTLPALEQEAPHEPQIESQEPQAIEPEKEADRKPAKPTWLPKGFEDAELSNSQASRLRRMHAQAQQARKAQSKIDELQRRLNALEEKLTSANLDELAKRRKAAIDEGDINTALELTEQLVEQKRAKASTPPVEDTPDEPEEVKLPANTGIEELPREIQDFIINWATEQNERGLVRPWATEGHPDNAVAVALAQSVFNDPKWYGKPVADLLNEVDERVTRYLSGTGKIKAVKTAAPVATSEGGGTTRARHLTKEQEAIARRLYGDDPKALERYMDGLRKVQK